MLDEIRACDADASAGDHQGVTYAVTDVAEDNANWQLRKEEDRMLKLSTHVLRANY